jgi:hypothetical protein
MSLSSTPTRSDGQSAQRDLRQLLMERHLWLQGNVVIKNFFLSMIVNCYCNPVSQSSNTLGGQVNSLASRDEHPGTLSLPFLRFYLRHSFSCRFFCLPSTPLGSSRALVVDSSAGKDKGESIERCWASASVSANWVDKHNVAI